MRKSTTLILLGLMFASNIFGQIPTVPNAAQTQTDETDRQTPSDKIPAGSSRALTATDVETFLDGIVPLQLTREDVAGAVVSVVKDGKILFAKGYGFADVATKKPVSPPETLFRVGSISKLFVWTAVMQLHEQGKINLDADISEYLDFKIPDAFGQPITLKNVMTHTAGFEEQTKDLIAFDKENPNLGDYLKNHVPARIFPPGTTPAYSNYATALAGYVVERVSGQPFNDYVAEKIFKPLGMARSTFAQPLPPELAPLMSSGYKLASDKAEPFEIVGPFPAGSMSSTAEDISKFLLAHLQNGSYNGAQILKPETVKLMHSRLFALDDRVNAMCYGFYEESRNGRRIIGHGGDTVQFHSDSHLILDEAVGFFVSYNSAGRAQISTRDVLLNAFLDRYFPDARGDAQPTLATAKEDAARVAGTYMISRRGEKSFVKLLAVLGVTSVYANEDDTISIADLLGVNGKPKRWRAVASLTFREVGGQDVVVFKEDANGRMRIALPYAFMIFERVGFWQNGKIILPVAGISLFIMFTTLVLWFVAWLVRRSYGRKLELTPWEWRLRMLVRIVFALDLIFIAAFLVFGVMASSDFSLLSDSGNNILRIIQVIGVLGAIGSIIVFANFVHAWLSKRCRIWDKLQATVFVFAALGFLWLVLAGNVLRLNSNF